MSYLIQRLNGSNTTYGISYAGNYAGTKKLYVRTAANGILTYPLTTDTSASQYCKFKILISAGKTAYLAKSWSKTTTTWKNSMSKTSTITTTTWKNSMSRASTYTTFATGTFSTWQISSTGTSSYSNTTTYSSAADYRLSKRTGITLPSNTIGVNYQTISTTSSRQTYSFTQTDTGPIPGLTMHIKYSNGYWFRYNGRRTYYPVAGNTTLSHQVVVLSYRGTALTTATKLITSSGSYNSLWYFTVSASSKSFTTTQSWASAEVTYEYLSTTVGYVKWAETGTFGSMPTTSSYFRETFSQRITASTGTYSYKVYQYSSTSTYRYSLTYSRTSSSTYTSTNWKSGAQSLISSSTRTTASGTLTRSSGYTTTSTAVAGTSQASATITSGTRSSGYTTTSTTIAGTSQASGTTTSGTTHNANI